ncbi:hypothetical protein ACXR0O_00890 [Verrucomicrobiota bacterium sgz303538]
MKKQLIDITIAADDITAVTTALTTLQTKLSFLLPLEEAERKRLRRLGLRNETFSLGVIDIAQGNPQVVPAGIDMAALQRDVAAREQLLPLLREMQRLTRLMEDTVILLGCDIYEGGRALYKTMKVVGELHGLSEVIAELGRRFAKKRTTEPATGSTAASTGAS